MRDFARIVPLELWFANQNRFLYIHGEAGTGKTHLACAILKQLRRASVSCGFQTTSELFLQLRGSFRDESTYGESDILRKFRKPRAWVFDDIGAQKMSEYVIEAWYCIIDWRYSSMTPTVFTSNLSLEEISKRMGDRIASRLASGVVFGLNGRDRRLSGQVGH